jgi:hypothetical protein
MNPLVHAVQKQLARASSRRPELSQKITQLRRLVASGVSKINMGDVELQQTFADQAYDGAEGFIPLAKDDIVLRGVVDALLVLQNTLSEFTPRAVGDDSRIVVIKGIATFIPPDSIHALVVEAIGRPMLSQEALVQLNTLFEYLTQDIGSLPAPLASAVKTIQALGSIVNNGFDVLRILIASQASFDARKLQARELAVEFSVRGARLSGDLKTKISGMQTGEHLFGTNVKLSYYLAHLMALLKIFDPQVLIDSRSFASATIAYGSLKDIRMVMPLILEETQDTELVTLCRLFMEVMDQLDLSFALAFTNELAPLVRATWVMLKLGEVAEAKEKVTRLKALCDTPSLLLWNNFVAFGAAHRDLSQLEDDITPLMATFASTTTAANLQAQFESVRDYKLVLLNWCNPMTELFVTNSLHIQLRSLLGEARPYFAPTLQVLDARVLAVPITFSRAIARLSEGMALVFAARWRQPELAAKCEPIQALLESASTFAGYLSRDAKAYKADAGFQKSAHTIVELSDALLAEIVTVAIDYTEPPKAIGVISQRQIDMVLSAVEKTPIFNLAKDLCVKLRDLVSEMQIDPINGKVLANMIDMIPLYGHMSPERASAELAGSVKEVLDSNAAPGVVAGQIAKSVAALLRTIASLDEKVITALGVSPLNLLTDIVTTWAPDAAASKRGFQAAIDEFTKLDIFFCADVDNPGVVRASVVEYLVALTEGVKAGDAGKVHKHLLFLTGLDAAALKLSISDTLLAEARPKLAPIEPIYAAAFTQGSNAPLAANAAAVAAARDSLIELLTNEGLKIAIEIDAAASLEDLLEIKTRSGLLTLIFSDTPEPFSLPNLKALLSATSTVQILAQKSLAQATNRTPGPCLEYVKLFVNASKALASALAKQSPQELRLYKRYCANIADIVDDLFLAQEEEAPTITAITESQLATIWTIARLVAVIARINAARGSARVDDSFQLIQDRQAPVLKQLSDDLTGQIARLQKVNTKRELSEELGKLLPAAQATITGLTVAFSSPELRNLLDKEGVLGQAFGGLAAAISGTTDAIILVYDPERAAHLPAKFVVPPMPSDSTAGKPLLACADLMAAVQGQLGKLPQFRETLLGALTNEELVALIEPFYAEVNVVLTHTLRLSVSSVSLSNQLALTSAASGLARVVDNLNRGLRSKLLANPAWITEVTKALDDLPRALELILGLAEAAKKLAEEEESKMSEVKAKIFAVLTPLRELMPTLTAQIKALKEGEPSPVRNFASLLVNISNTAATIMGRILLHVKDQGKDGAELERSLAVGRDLIALLNQVLEETKKGDKADLAVLLALTEKVNAVLQRFADEVTPGSVEGNELKEQVALIVKSSAGLKVTIARSIEQANKPKPPPKPAAPPPRPFGPTPTVTVQAPAAAPAPRPGRASGASKTVSLSDKDVQEKLKTRLNLEAQVNEFRWRVEFLEKELNAISG